MRKGGGDSIGDSSEAERQAVAVMDPRQTVSPADDISPADAPMGAISNVPLDEVIPDGGLTDALEAGDLAVAMHILVMTHGNEVYAYCRRWLANDVDAEDVSQTVFVQAFESLQTLADVDRARAWLLAIARHRCLDRLNVRRRGPQPVDDQLLLSLLDEQLVGEPMDIDPRVIVALDACLDCLHPRTRAILILRFRDGLSFNEIGSMFSAQPGALRVRVGRALNALHRCLKNKRVRP